MYKCVKVPLKHILIDPGKHIPILNNAVYRTNQIIILAYQLIRLWILTKYEETKIVPTINKETFNTAFKVITRNSNKCTKPLYLEFKKLFEFNQIDGKLLTQILYQYASTEMMTAFENNIKIHFFDYLFRFVNTYWKHKYSTELEEKKLNHKDLRKELRKVKSDLICGTKKCDSKYQSWIDDVKSKCLPEITSDKSHSYNVKANPQEYLCSMIWMNKELENIKAKMFQSFPLRSNIVPKFIHIDNTVIIKLLLDTSEKKDYIGKITETKKLLWTKVFHTKYIDKIRMNKNYVFDYAFMTDGYSASLRFIHIDEYIKQLGIKEKRVKGMKETKGLTKEERRKRQIDKNKNKTKKDTSNPTAKPTTPKETTNEFLYIDDINIELLNKPYVVVDPGKRDLLTIMNKDGKMWTYSNKQRVHDTKRLKYQRHLRNVKENLGVIEVEQELSGFNSKTCDTDKFRAYCKEKNKINEQLLQLYQDNRFRQYRWYSYINTMCANQNMCNAIKERFGKDITIIHGDWSQGKQMRNFLSTPNLGIKRKLSESFELYDIDEYRTSKLHHKTEETCENLKLPDKIGKLRKQHSILTYKMENGRLGCINRDRNACMNMIKLVEYYKKTQTRPTKYSRSIKGCDQEVPLTNEMKTLNTTEPERVQGAIYVI